MRNHLEEPKTLFSFYQDCFNVAGFFSKNQTAQFYNIKPVQQDF
jgi:hypothetical protein